MLLLNILFHRGNWPSLLFTLRMISGKIVTHKSWIRTRKAVAMCSGYVQSMCTVDWKELRGWCETHEPGSPGWAPVCPTAGSSRGRTCWRGGSPSSAIPSQISSPPDQLIALSTADQPQQVTLLTPHYREQTSSSSLIHKTSLFPFTRWLQLRNKQNYRGGLRNRRHFDRPFVFLTEDSYYSLVFHKHF